MHRLSRLLFPCLVVLMVAPILVAPSLTRADSPPGRYDLPRHSLIFSRHSDATRSDYDVWWMCADGTQMASLVTEPLHQIQLAVSPDGNEFAYTSGESGKRDIWRKPFGRGEAVRVTHDEADDFGPVWSPDGTRVAYFSTRDAEKPELYIQSLEVEAEAMGDTSVAGPAAQRWTKNEVYDSGADWSPDGSTIIFTRYFPGDGDHDGIGEIIALSLESNVETQLTDLGGYNGGLHFSPDGRTIVFHRVADGRAELWLVNADGSNPRAITDTYVDEYSPRWSPDGGWIAYTAGVGNDSMGTFDLWLMRSDGRDRHLLVAGENTEGWPRWRPGEHYCR